MRTLSAGEMQKINKTFENIEALDINITSGDCEIKTSDSKITTVEIKFDVEISTASGNTTLDYNGNKIIGTIEMTTLKIRGKITVPFKCDKQEEFEKNDRTYIRQTYIKGNKTPINELPRCKQTEVKLTILN